MKDMGAELVRKIFRKPPTEPVAGSKHESTLRSRVMDRRTFLAGIAASGLAIAGCKAGDSTKIPGPDADHPTATTIPVVTTEASTTSIKVEKPTDVMEVYADGSERLRNGGVLYKGEKNELPEWFGGIQIHIIDLDGNKTGLQEGAQNTIFDSLLWAFASQKTNHPEFFMADGQVDIEAYKLYLEQNNWVDPEVFVPANVSEGRSSGYSSVAPSEPIMLDFKEPFIIGNGDLAEIDGFKLENPNYYTTAPGQQIGTLFGITNDGQLYYSVYEGSYPDQVRRLRVGWANGINNLYMTSEQLGGVLTVTGRITHPEASAADQYKKPFLYYYDDMWATPTGIVAPYPILDIGKFADIDHQNNVVNEILFHPVS